MGDLILDTFTQGEVRRISPEAPVPVLVCSEDTDIAGGAANVAANVEALGGHALLFGVAGDDAPGSRLIACLDRLPWATPPVIPRRAGWQTPHKIRYRAGAQHLLRVDYEAEGDQPEAFESAGLLAAVEAAAGAVRMAVISDYRKGTLAPAVCRGIMARLRQHGVPVLVDTKSTDLGPFAGATLITPNLGELAKSAGRPVGSLDEAADAARGLLVAHDIGAAVVTMGARGMLIVERDRHRHLPALARQLYDVSGAGDTVVAALAVALAEDMALDEATRFANTAAALAVEKPGTGVVTRGEVVARTAPPHAVPVLDASRDGAALRALVATWRASGLRVGFTNGCFDILHPGHLKIITEAAAHCDRLVVGVNTDHSVKRLKGPSRPVQPEDIRAMAVRGVPGVAAVVTFADDTPAALIAAIEPDLLAKGSDYTLDRIVGAVETIARGGTVLRVPLLDGHSTSGLIRTMTPEPSR
ncbi:PfkB family carbohydrate kinase [Prosthecomicrobium pneumaticum]|uniref:Bifunctional protein HldE n=1 Tax=Prosthecomicrobium pneumaticum TaxID=81895 RepID=A0A7W9CTG6_9HYPH|nr:PfkB family carbohydrate kinase [Prosthecomicrobium pneumaticum]MBB5751595.1 D-beta-D-heptose 7-phosphate kinase/D-beta-D-heptose 1-phosphate adenosyltransferase [Prosthecomicrobium pneumaticum]